ncbi:MAG: hypothetical protein H6835_11715 [Planctomycetes bacterium]|nr:hypothetical protein [Planctomycetota bacterium]
MSTASPRPRSRRRQRQLKLIAACFGVGLALLLAEVVLHVAPGLLPAAFRERYPPHGVEFSHPGLLDRTPILAVPLPFGVDPYDGPPPHDLVGLGIAPQGAIAQDLANTPRIVVPADEDGLPNRAPHTDTADVVFVGDSFTVFAAQREPAGLQPRFELALGTSVYNLGIAGLDPLRERWLLEQRGLPAQPKLVVWFFFGGNDLTDTVWLMVQQGDGAATYGDLFADRRAPFLRLPALVASWLVGPPAPALAGEPLPPLETATSPPQRMWFHPDVLRTHAAAPELIAAHPAWAAVQDALRSARRRSEAQGARFLLVYLPSKPQVYLPRVTADAALLRRYVEASQLFALPLHQDAEAERQALLEHRGAVEGLVSAFCAAEGIALWSATPTLEAAADNGEQLYYATDTHWTAAGQRHVADALIDHVQKNHLLAR